MHGWLHVASTENVFFRRFFLMHRGFLLLLLLFLPILFAENRECGMCGVACSSVTASVGDFYS